MHMHRLVNLRHSRMGLSMRSAHALLEGNHIIVDEASELMFVTANNENA